MPPQYCMIVARFSARVRLVHRGIVFCDVSVFGISLPSGGFKNVRSLRYVRVLDATGRTSGSSPLFASNSGRKLWSTTSKILPNCEPYVAYMRYPACFRKLSNAVAEGRSIQAIVGVELKGVS